MIFLVHTKHKLLKRPFSSALAIFEKKIDKKQIASYIPYTPLYNRTSETGSEHLPAPPPLRVSSPHPLTPPLPLFNCAAGSTDGRRESRKRRVGRSRRSAAAGCAARE